MKLSTQADYAVRAVFELARREPGAVLHTVDIAGAQRIPPARLAKVVRDLARADLVRTQRGQQGGVMLARPAGRITVRDVYEAVEGPIMLCRCRQRVERCGDDECDTHEFWSSVEALLNEELETVTFAALAAAEAEGLAEGFMGREAGQVRFAGHGVGLELDELPVIAGNDLELAEGMGFALEPKFVLPGLGAGGIENTWLVGTAGTSRLTTAEERIFEID